MPLFGAHAFIWAGEWTPEGAEKVIRGAAEAGLDFVEIPLLHPESMDVSGTRELLDRYGIGCTCSLGLPKAAHLPLAPEAAEGVLPSGGCRSAPPRGGRPSRANLTPP